MVRQKNIPNQNLAASAPATPEMGVNNCHTCQLAMNRPGEKRPSIRCKECRNEHCNKCAEVVVEFCEMVKTMGKDFWTCKACESKTSDMKAVLETIKSIKEDQAEQRAEREQVLQSLKTVEAVVKRVERVEEVQEIQEQRISKNEDAIKKHSQKREEGEKRLKKLEDQVEKIDQSPFDMRQCNAVAREVREMEKREKNVVFFNVAEPKEGEEEDTKKEDLAKIQSIFHELGLEGIQPIEARRIGKTGKYPRKILVTLGSREECEKTVKKSRDGPALTDNIFLTRDRTFNQRQEAKLFRIDKEREGEEMAHSERGRGRGRGRPRGRGNGGRGRGSRTAASESRKRRNSEDEVSKVDDDESKRRRTEVQTSGGAEGATSGGGGAAAAEDGTPDIQRVVRSVSDRPGTPRSVPDSELRAVGGVEQNF